MKAKVGVSASKVMATVFWDASGVSHFDYLEKIPNRANKEKCSKTIAQPSPQAISEGAMQKYVVLDAPNAVLR